MPLYIGAKSKGELYLGSQPDRQFYLGETSFWPDTHYPVPTRKDAAITLSPSGNVSTLTSYADNIRMAIADEPVPEGKIYFEITITKTRQGGSGGLGFGLTTVDALTNYDDFNLGCGSYWFGGTPNTYINNNTPPFINWGTAWADGDVLSLEFDSVAQIIRFRQNGGTWTADQSTAAVTDPRYIYTYFADTNAGAIITLNTGDSPFVYEPSAGFRGVAWPASDDISIPNLEGQWSTAMNAYLRGERNVRVGWEGDSTGAGYGAIAAALTRNNKAMSTFSQMCSRINRRTGLYANASAIVGSNNATDTRVYDYQVSFPNSQGWAFASQGVEGDVGKTAGGWLTLAQTYNPPSKYNFAPVPVVDTFEFINPKNINVDKNWILSVNDIEKQTVANGSALYPPGELVTETVTETVGQNILNFKASNTTTTYFVGVIAYNSAAKEITLLNMGWSGAKTTDWLVSVNTAWNPQDTLDALDLDLAIICIGINDYNNGSPISTSTFQTNVETMIQRRMDAGSSVLVVVPNPIGGTYSANGNTYATAIIAAATAKGVPYLDVRTLPGFADYTTANSNGLMYDTLHPNAVGYGIIAKAISEYILPLDLFPEIVSDDIFVDTFQRTIATTQDATKRLSDTKARLVEGTENTTAITTGPLIYTDGFIYFNTTNAQGARGVMANIMPDTPDYEVEIVVNWKSVINGELTGVYGRWRGDNREAYHVRFNSGTGVQLYYVQPGGVFTQIGSNYSFTPTVGVDYTLILRMNGTTISAILNGVEIISGTNSTRNRLGFAAIRSYPVGSGQTTTTGAHIKSFKIRKLAA